MFLSTLVAAELMVIHSRAAKNRILSNLGERFAASIDSAFEPIELCIRDGAIPEITRATRRHSSTWSWRVSRTAIVAIVEDLE